MSEIVPLGDVTFRLDRKIVELFPDDLPNEQIDVYCRQAIDAAEISSREYSINLAVLGRCMAIAAKRGKPFLEHVGAGTLGEYESMLDPRGGRHGSIYAYKLSCELWPNRTLLEIVDAGSSYLIAASRVAKLMPTQAEKEKIFEEALAAPTVKALVSTLESRTGEGFTQAASWTLTGDAAEVAEAKELCRLLKARVPGENRQNGEIAVVLSALQSLAAEEQDPIHEGSAIIGPFPGWRIDDSTPF